MDKELRASGRKQPYFNLVSVWRDWYKWQQFGKKQTLIQDICSSSQIKTVHLSHKKAHIKHLDLKTSKQTRGTENSSLRR
jgi:hypothetical protein